MLLYTKLTKYVFLAVSCVSFTLNIKKLSLLGRKEKLEKDKDLNQEFDVIDDPDIEEIRSKKKLRSKSDLIKEKYKENG